MVSGASSAPPSVAANSRESGGQGADMRRRIRQSQSLPRVEKLKIWFDDENLKRLSGKSKIAGAMRYALHHWQGLTLFLDDGRIENDSNTVERSIRPLALDRKNALFAGHDRGGTHWATIASLIETCKLNGVDPQAYLASVLSRLAMGWPNSKIDELLPWAYASGTQLQAVA